MENSFAQGVIEDTPGEIAWRPAIIIIDNIEHIAVMANAEIDPGRNLFRGEVPVH
jgi:hypothetical protein